MEEEGKGVEANEEYSKILSENELWARLDQLEKLEEQQDEEDRYTQRIGACHNEPPRAYSGKCLSFYRLGYSKQFGLRQGNVFHARN